MEIRVIGVPVFEGCNIRGVETAPSVIRKSGVLDILKENFTVVDGGDIDLLPSSEDSMFSANPQIKYADVLLDMGQKLCAKVNSAMDSGAFVLTIGGDHSLGVGTVAGASMANDHNIGVVWIDAHSDINTPLTSPSKNYHGMPLASSLYIGDNAFRTICKDKRKVKPENTYLLGVRSMDQGEVEFKESAGINHYTVPYIHQFGMTHIAQDIVKNLKANGIDKLHLSFDLDVLSPSVTSAFNCPVENGITKEELLEFLTAILSSGIVCSLDITEYNPEKDEDGSGIAVIRDIIATLNHLNLGR